MAKQDKIQDEIMEVIPIDDFKQELQNLPDINKSDKDVDILKNELTSIDVGIDKPLTVYERFVIEKKSLGWSEKRIAQELGVDEAAVKRTLNNPIVKETYNEVMQGLKDGIKNEIVGIYMRIVRDKVRAIEEKDGDFSKASRRDLADILLSLDNIMKEEEKKKLGTSGNVFVNILQQVIKD